MDVAHIAFAFFSELRPGSYSLPLPDKIKFLLPKISNSNQPTFVGFGIPLSQTQLYAKRN